MTYQEYEAGLRAWWKEARETAEKRLGVPLEKLITHKVPLEDVEAVLATIEKAEMLEGREIVKAMMVPDISERQ